jgi:hypothetical protein
VVTPEMESFAEFALHLAAHLQVGLAAGEVSGELGEAQLGPGDLRTGLAFGLEGFLPVQCIL